jgi:hypothetical protein
LFVDEVFWSLGVVLGSSPSIADNLEEDFEDGVEVVVDLPLRSWLFTGAFVALLVAVDGTGVVFVVDCCLGEAVEEVEEEDATLEVALEVDDVLLEFLDAEGLSESFLSFFLNERPDKEDTGSRDEALTLCEAWPCTERRRLASSSRPPLLLLSLSLSSLSSRDLLRSPLESEGKLRREVEDEEEDVEERDEEAVLGLGFCFAFARSCSLLFSRSSSLRSFSISSRTLGRVVRFRVAAARYRASTTFAKYLVSR